MSWEEKNKKFDTKQLGKLNTKDITSLETHKLYYMPKILGNTHRFDILTFIRRKNTSDTFILPIEIKYSEAKKSHFGMRDVERKLKSMSKYKKSYPLMVFILFSKSF